MAILDTTKLRNEHDEAAKRIQKQVEYFHRERKHFRVYHGSTSSTRPISFQRDSIVDVSDMNRLFPINKETMTVQCEPKVPMDDLVAHCLKDGLVPKVVMEFKGITVGGGFSGFSGESSMYRYGLFNNTVSDIEMVLGDGTLEYASRTKNEDLLEHAAGSLGTFGIVTLLTVELIPAKSYIKVDIYKADDISTAYNMFEEATGDPEIHFIDGDYLGKNCMAVMFGRFVDAPPKGQTALKKMQVHWFADTIESIIINKQPTRERPHAIYMDTTSYLFRYDHGAFWGGKLAFEHFHIPQNSLTRRLADPFLDSRTCYHALHKSGLGSEYVVQDFGIPGSNVVEFVKSINDILPQLQIFLTPGRRPDETGLTSRLNPRIIEMASQRVFNVGVYGRGPRDPKEFYDLNRKLEQRSAELLGVKLLYARTYYTEEEFWGIYDKDAYLNMRKKYKADNLPTIYEKLKADMSTGVGKRRPIRGILETVWDKAIGHKEYLLKK